MKRVIALLFLFLLCGCKTLENMSSVQQNIIVSDMEVSFCDEEIPTNLSVNSCVNIRLSVKFADNSEIKRLKGEDITVTYNKEDVFISLLNEAGKEFVYTIIGKLPKKSEVSFSYGNYKETFFFEYYDNEISSKLLYIKKDNGIINCPLYISSYSQYIDFVNEYKLPVVGKVITEKFFEDKCLLLTTLSHSSSVNEYKLAAAFLFNDELYLNFSYDYTETFTNDIVKDIYYLELNNSCIDMKVNYLFAGI